MYEFKHKDHVYNDALDLKYDETKPVAKQHNTKQTCINMTFDTVEDVAGFTGAVFNGNKEKVYIVEPNFLSPRTEDDLFHDYSAKCVIM